jgi:hypothetical protein
MDVLLTWVGARDPDWRNQRTGRIETGPVLSLLRERRFDVLYVFLNLYSRADDFRQRATALVRAIMRETPDVRIRQCPVDLVSVVDYVEIFRVVNHACQSIVEVHAADTPRYYVFLSPGTPQMQTVWVVLVQSGLLPATMIQTTPEELRSPGTPVWQEVRLPAYGFPRIVSPEAAAREAGIVQARMDNLFAENRALRAQLEVARVGGPVTAAAPLPEGFELREYLLTQERAMYVRALDQAGDNAAAAARLLGVEPAAFRARAVSLGIRPRRARRAVT